MNAPQLSARDLRAAAEVHRELGPEYGDAVVDSFLEKVETRIDARLAEMTPVRKRPVAKASPSRRRSLLTGVAVGGGSVGVLLTFLDDLLIPPSYGYDAAHHILWQLLLVASAGSLVAGLFRMIRDHD